MSEVLGRASGRRKNRNRWKRFQRAPGCRTHRAEAAVLMRAGEGVVSGPMRAGERAAGGPMRAGERAVGGPMRAGERAAGGPMRAGERAAGGPMRAGERAAGVLEAGSIPLTPCFSRVLRAGDGIETVSNGFNLLAPR